MINASIVSEPGENIESLIRRFKKTVDKANVIRNYARNRYFVPKSARSVEKSRRARARKAKYEQS